MSAPSSAVRAAVYRRDKFRCAACPSDYPLSFQHRQATGMGGDPEPPTIVQGLTLCVTCNWRCENDRQTQALLYGHKVRRWVRDPADVPVFYANERLWYRLEDEARIFITPTIALDLMLEVYGDEYLQWGST
jgi:hypothetical protein